jgi:hypothetical protein
VPRKVIDREDHFDDNDELEGTEMAPSPRPAMPMDEADRVRNNQFPTAPHISPKVLLEQEKARRAAAEEELKQVKAAGQALAADGIITVQGFQLTPTGLRSPEMISPNAWVDVGRLLAKLEGSLQWLVGDWIVYGEAIKWGDTEALAGELGCAVQTVYDYASVSRKVQFSIRIENLSFAHHRLVTSMTPDFQSYALKFAAHHKYSVAEMRRWIKLDMPEEGLPKEPPALKQADTPALPAGNTLDSDSISTYVSDFNRVMSDPGVVDRLSQAERNEIIRRSNHAHAEFIRRLKGGK